MQDDAAGLDQARGFILPLLSQTPLPFSACGFHLVAVGLLALLMMRSNAW